MKRMNSLAMATLAVLTLVLSGCASSGNAGPVEADAAAQTTTTQSECTGVWAQVDFEAESNASCVDAVGPITALQAFESANFALEPVSTSDQFFACRIDGLPAAGETLEYNGETYTPDCSDFGPMWAYWGLYVDAGNGWEYALEGAGTQLMQPGQAVAFVWQFGDTEAEPTLPHASTD